jgi:hypothetical protein
VIVKRKNSTPVISVALPEPIMIASVPTTYRRLAGLVWEGGADAISRFIQIALSDEPFPI